MSDRDLSLVETSDGLQVILDGRSLYDQHPASHAEAKADSIPISEDTLYLVASPAAWHGVRRLAERIPKSSQVVAVESDPLLLELATRLARQVAPQSVQSGQRFDPARILCPATSADVHALLQSCGTEIGAYRRVRQISFCRGAALGGREYRLLRESLEQSIRISWQNRITSSQLARLWFTNLFRNLPLVSRGATLPRVHGPVIICGAGTSLDAAVELLKRVRNDVTIVAADTALPVLFQNGVTPQIVVATEAQVHNVYDFLSPVSGYTLAADLVSAPVVIDRHEANDIAWLCTRVTDDSIFDRLKALRLSETEPLGSVGVTAVSLSLVMTDGPVFLTGLDFALPSQTDQSNRAGTHARGSGPHLDTIASWDRFHPPGPAHLRYRLLTRKGLAGEVTTTLPMIAYAEQLGMVLSEDKSRHPNRKVYQIHGMGLEVGADAISARTAAGLIAKMENPSVIRESASRVTATAVAALLNEERNRLERLRDGVQSAIEHHAEVSLDLFRECSYVARSFPDFTGELRPDQAFLIRLRVSIDYYLSRIELSLRSLRS